MDYVSNYLNYYIYGIEKINLSPSQDFLNGKSLISILQQNGKDYYLPINYTITKIEYIPLTNKNNIYDFEIHFNNENTIYIDDENQIQMCNINYEIDQCFIIKLNSNSLPTLPLNNINNFNINLTIIKNNKNYNYISLNTLVYKNTILPKKIDEAIVGDKKDIGFCFSGGGPRSFSASIGYIRALYKLNIIKDIKYISCVSGSTWAWIPYTFLDSNADEEKFIGYDIFGNINRKLNIADVNYTDKNYLGNSLISKAYNYQLIKYIYDGIMHLGYNQRSRIWPYMLGKILLEPYKIMNADFFAPNKKIVDIFNEYPLNTNQKYKIPYNKNRPFIITNSGVVKPNKRGTLTNTDFNLIEMTPLYSGTLSILDDGIGKYGGHYLNTYSFNPEKFIMKEKDIAEVKLLSNNNLNNINYLNLFDMMGSSSTAYGIITDYLGLTCANPSYNFVDNNMNIVKSFDCIDGGVLDNAGILPMLQRQVKNIVLFVNTNNKIDISDDDKIMTKSVDIMLRQLFLGDNEVNKQWYFHHFEYICDLQVFETNRWKEFLNKMRHNIKTNDIAYVEMNKLKVLKNDNFQIKEYILDNLQIIYLYETKTWKENRLNDEVRELLNTDELKHFPYYSTIFENNGWIDKEIIALTAPQLNLLSDLTYYNMINNKIINKGIMNIINNI